LCALLALAWYLARRYRATAYRRRALAQLARLQSQYQQDHDERQLIAETNALLKSVALVAYPRREVAASSGAEWLAFLNRALKPEEQFPGAFVTGAYRRSSPEVDVAQLQRSAAAWIRRHKVTP
jgi:hypothetical protein